MNGPELSHVRFAEASPILKARGIHGWICCEYGDLQLDGLRVRRHEDGRYSLGFPSRIDGSGIERAYYRPLDQAARELIETQVLGELRRLGNLPGESSAAHFPTPRTSERRP